MGMEVNNPLYRRQGIHAIASIFTVDKGEVKVLLIKRNNEPYKDMWALVGGAIHNDEDLEVGLKREVREKTGINLEHYFLANVFGKVKRSPVMRMVAISYIGVIDRDKVSLVKETLKTNDADWFSIDKLPRKLAYDHEEILKDSIIKLAKLIGETNILKTLLPDCFTMPELQKVYEVILKKEIDRRNFRKRMLTLGLIEDTGKMRKEDNKKATKLYCFTDKVMDKNVF